MTTVNAADILNTRNKRREININRYIRLNDNIRASTIRVIDQDGKPIGVISKSEALEKAKNAGLDLVEVSPDANPPVAKIIDWGKYNYQRTKQLQKSKRKSRTSSLKQMRFGLKISDHDIDVKLNKVKSFLENGDKVKLMVMYRGREMAHLELGNKLIDKLLSQLGKGIIVDQPALLAGRQLSVVIRKNHAKVKNS